MEFEAWLKTAPFAVENGDPFHLVRADDCNPGIGEFFDFERHFLRNTFMESLLEAAEKSVTSVLSTPGQIEMCNIERRIQQE